MDINLIFPPLFGAAIGISVALAALIVLKNKLKEGNNGIEGDFKELFDTHLDDLVAAFGRQIPMASLFLTGSIAAKMKLQAKEELLKLTPEIKKKIYAGIRSKFFWLCAGAGLIGFFLGVLQSMLFFFAG